MGRILMKGNEAIGEAAIRAGCLNYFGYPITPQSEVAEYLARRLPEVGGVFLQGESEVAVSYMIFGAAGAGARVFTTSSSPGVSLMCEGISYIAGAECPAVFVNIMRGSPGLGGILPSQGDYLQATKGGGHGDYRMLVMAPASVQEAIDYIILAFDLADKYRCLAFVLVDGNIGQMMEPAELPPMRELPKEAPEWALTGAQGREPNILTSIYINPIDEEQTNIRLYKRWMEIEEKEVLFEENDMKDAEIAIIAFGTAGRVASSAIKTARQEGIKVGLFRPITLAPFPSKQLEEISKRVKSILVVEMNTGQMLDDVNLAVNGRVPVEFYGRLGGVTPFPDEILEEIHRINENPPTKTIGNARREWLERFEKILEGGN